MSQRGTQAGSAKGKKSSKSGPESKSEEVLQAVILADSFQDRFKPFTIDKPRCLLPLANTPLIEYTLEFLAMNGIQEVYIYCGAHTDQVEDYIDRSRWSTNSRTTPFSVLDFVRVADARSTGDILRDLDKRSLVDGDFIVVHGDLVSNIMLDDALAAHRKRREISAANIMTAVLTSGGLSEHRTKAKGITPIFAIDTNTQRCLHYEEMNPLQSDHYLALDPAIPDELSKDFEIRTDLIDAEIDICTPEVLALWSESFDYELPRKNFLHGVLKDWELNGKMIYADILEEGYAARASNLQMYNAITCDVLGRWTFPFTPECNLLPNQTYRSHGSSVWMEAGSNHAADAKLSNSIIAKDAYIGAGSSVTNSTIGKGCKIGSNVTIDHCTIWQDVEVSDDVSMVQSVVADGAIIGKSCSLQPGCLISFNVEIGEGSALPASTVLSTVLVDGTPATKDTSLLGPRANASIFVDPEDEELEEDDPARLQKSLIYSLADANVSNSSVSTLSSEVLSDDEDGLLDTPNTVPLSARSPRSSFASDEGTSFHADAVHGILDALRIDGRDFDSAKLEFMGLRLANNASDSMMRRAIATAFARRAAELLTPEHGGPLEPSKAAEKALTSNAGASKFIDEVAVGGGDPEQVDFTLALQRALRHVKGPEQGKAGTLLAALLQQLYALDILEEDGILAWWGDSRSQEGDGMAPLRAKCQVLVEWLENAEEEDDDSDDDED